MAMDVQLVSLRWSGRHVDNRISTEATATRKGMPPNGIEYLSIGDAGNPDRKNQEEDWLCRHAETLHEFSHLWFEVRKAFTHL